MPPTFRKLELACARLEGEGGPARAAAPCFETHRSAAASVEMMCSLRCDAPQHEADRDDN
jgi:hypothetical protein